MRILKSLLFFLVQLLCLQVSAADYDSLYIADVKKFAFREIGVELKGELFTRWNESESPYFYVYVSLSDRVESPKEFTSSFIFCRNNPDSAEQVAALYTAKGYQAFCYKTYANSGTALTKKFLSYPDENKSFIVFHELIHNYIRQEKISIPYEFNEALSDVIGNYGTLNFSRETGKTDAARAELQIQSNEKIYQCMNRFIQKINHKPSHREKYYKRCREIIHDALDQGTAFQIDRFDFPVNNAYLLKNLYYCKNYFLLKKVLLKQKTILEFLEIMKHLPANSEECTRYLEKYR
jgi:hypothetical protein